MEKICIDKLSGSQPPEDYEQIPYVDIENIAIKLNEIIDWINEHQ